MRYGITCDGTPVGSAEITALAGLPHAEFEPLAGYSAIRYQAIEAGAGLHERRGWPVTAGDFAEEFARAWTGGRLALTDSEGTELTVASVVVVEDGRSISGRGPVVIVDARPDMARVEAFLRITLRDGKDRSRPAG